MADKQCRCGFAGPHIEDIGPFGQHYGKLRCGQCATFITWIAKPDSDTSKYRRPNAHRDLVKRYGKGVCEMCCQKKEDLPKGQTLEAQHVVEFADGGSDERENIWIVCTGCHRLIHWVRYYHGGDPKQLIEMIGKEPPNGSH